MDFPPKIRQIIIETPRLQLKELNPEIIRFLYLCTSNEQMAYLGFSTLEELELEKFKLESKLHGNFLSFKSFLLIDIESDRILGHAGFHTWFTTHFRAEIGYRLFQEDDMGKGFMKEALKPIIGYGFEQMNLNRIEALVGPTNLPSLKLVRNLGFKEEGLLREHYYSNGVLQDSIMFSLLKSEVQTDEGF